MYHNFKKKSETRLNNENYHESKLKLLIEVTNYYCKELGI